MEKNPLNKGVLSDNFVGIGPVTRGMVDARADELALMADRTPPQATPADVDRAERELAGGPDMDSQAATLESFPETKRWDPVPGSTGHHAPESPDEDEDDEGRSETEQLVEEGVEEAARDRSLQAARAAARENQASR